MDKKMAFLGASVGSIVGSYVPVLFGVNVLSAWSVIMGGIGGLAGIWLVWRLF